MTYKIVVPISGGKDSQACLKLALLHHLPDDILGLFCDTKFEHPDTYAHVLRIANLYDVKIVTVNGGDVLSECERYRRFPGGGARHCTDTLKIRESRIFYKAMAEAQGGFEVWYGMRSEESSDRKLRYLEKLPQDLYCPHEIMPRKYPKYLGKMGVRFRLPILDWGKGDVFELLNGEEHPHYAEGFDRVDCFPCLMANDKHKAKAFAYDEFGAQQRDRVMDLSRLIGKSVWTSKAGIAEHGGGCLICSI